MVKDLLANNKKDSYMTVGEQLLFKRDFKKTPKIWKPNEPLKIGKMANFINENYVEFGPDEKLRQPPLSVWASLKKSSCFKDEVPSMSPNYEKD